MFKKMMVAAAIAAAGLAHAQAPASTAPAANNAKKALVARILQLQQPSIEMLARQLTEHPASLMMQQVRPVVMGLPAERREPLGREIDGDVKKYVDETVPLVRDRAVKLAPTTVGSILEERFTEDELKQIITLLESPVNKKFQTAAPDMQRALGEKVVAETRTDVESRLRTLEQSVQKRISTAAAAPAGSGAATGAAAKPAPRPASAAKK